MVEETLLRSIVMDIKRRDVTDVRIYPFLIAAVVLAFVGTAIAGLITGRSQSAEDSGYYLVGIYIVGVGILLALMYLIVSRNYRHSKRDRDLAEHMCQLASQLESEGRFSDVRRLRKMSSSLPSTGRQKLFMGMFVLALFPALGGACDLVINGADPSTVGTANILFIASLVLSAASLLLNIGFPKRHENEFMRFTDLFCDGVKDAGLRAPRYQPVVGLRNWLLFLLLTFCTLFTFFPVWIYLSMRDMNRHLDQQWDYEESLVEFLEDL